MVVVRQRHAWTAQQGHSTDLRLKRRRRLMAKDVRRRESRRGPAKPARGGCVVESYCEPALITLGVAYA